MKEQNAHSTLSFEGACKQEKKGTATVTERRPGHVRFFCMLPTSKSKPGHYNNAESVGIFYSSQRGGSSCWSEKCSERCSGLWWSTPLKKLLRDMFHENESRGWIKAALEPFDHRCHEAAHTEFLSAHELGKEAGVLLLAWCWQDAASITNATAQYLKSEGLGLL